MVAAGSRRLRVRRVELAEGGEPLAQPQTVTDGVIMSDAFYKANLKRAPLRVGQPTEKVFEFLVGHDHYSFELRDHGELYGALKAALALVHSQGLTPQTGAHKNSPLRGHGTLACRPPTKHGTLACPVGVFTAGGK
jgi:hypothetical protein